MRQYTPKKSFIAFLLIGVLLLPFAMKTVHILSEEYHLSLLHQHDATSGKHHHCDDCAVCQFHLYNFIEAEALTFTVAPQLYTKPKSVSLVEKIAVTSILSFQLRGPPALT